MTRLRYKKRNCALDEQIEASQSASLVTRSEILHYIRRKILDSAQRHLGAVDVNECGISCNMDLDAGADDIAPEISKTFSTLHPIA